MGAVLALGLAAVPPQCSSARDGDDHGNHSDLKPWFDQMRSQRGLCCSFADGSAVKDADWDTEDGHYRVRIPAGSIRYPTEDGQGRYSEIKKPDQDEWVVVPDTAVVTEANRYGPAVVWPYWDPYKHVEIRCFIPGAGT